MNPHESQRQIDVVIGESKQVIRVIKTNSGGSMDIVHGAKKSQESSYYENFNVLEW